MLDHPTPAAPKYRPPRMDCAPDAIGALAFFRRFIANPITATPQGVFEKPYVLRKAGGRTIVFIGDPGLAEEILVRRSGDFPKSMISRRVLAPALGESLLVAEGEDWRWKRRLAAPTFAPTAIDQLAPRLVAPFMRQAERWAAGAAAPADVSAAMIEATLEAICDALFDPSDPFEAETIGGAIDDYLAAASWMMVYAMLKAPAWAPYPGKRRQARARDRVRGAVRTVIAERRRSGLMGADLTSLLMAARDPAADRPLSDEDLVDMLLTLVAAGHETSANALTWTLYCLAEQPELQERLAEEAAAAGGGGALDAAHLPELTRIEAAIKEGLRLFPTIPHLPRRTAAPQSLDDPNGGLLDLPAHAVILVSIYALHRRVGAWEDPDAFDIERWIDKPAPHRCLYMPFGAGPRVCIGARFAMVEMVLGLAALLRQVRFETCAQTRCDPLHRVSLAPRAGMMLRVSPR